MSTIKGFKVGNNIMTYQDANIADEFSESKTYEVGEYCIRPTDGKLYKCVVAVTLPSNWNSSNWEETQIDNELQNTESKIENINSELYNVPYMPSNARIDNNNLIELFIGRAAADTGIISASTSGNYYKTQGTHNNATPLLTNNGQSILVKLNLNWVKWMCWSYLQNDDDSTQSANRKDTHSDDADYIIGTKDIFISASNNYRYFIITFKKINNTAFTDEELLSIKTNLKFYVKADNSLTIDGVPANAKTVGDILKRYQKSLIINEPEITASSLFNSNTGIIQSSSSGKYARTDLYNGFGFYHTIYIKDNSQYKYNAVFYSGNGDINNGTDFIRRTDYSKEEIQIPSDAKKFGVNICRIDESPLTDEDIETIKSTLCIFSLNDRDNNIEGINNALAKSASTQLFFESGHIANNGAKVEDVTRIRSVNAKEFKPLPHIQKGDCYIVNYPYEAKVFIYAKTTIQVASLRGIVNQDWRTGVIQIPDEYIEADTENKFGAAITIRKIGHEDEDISSDIENISNYVSYVSPSLINKKNKPLRILAIGNSYTRNMLTYLAEIAYHCGYTNVTIVGSIQLGDSLERQILSHDSIRYGAAVYHKSIINGNRFFKKEYGKPKEGDPDNRFKFDDILKQEQWDYIVLQQSSRRVFLESNLNDPDNPDDPKYGYFDIDIYKPSNEDQAATAAWNQLLTEIYASEYNYNNINGFINYIKRNDTCENAKIGLVAPWTFAPDKNYGDYSYIEDRNDHSLQIKKIIPAVAYKSGLINFIVDENRLFDLAEQNPLLVQIADTMRNTDGNHIANGIPKYMAGILYAACVGIDISELDWHPPKLNPYLCWLARQAAKKIYNDFSYFNYFSDGDEDERKVTVTNNGYLNADDLDPEQQVLPDENENLNS